MKIFLSAFIIFISITASAQTDSLQKSKPDSLWYRNPFFRIYPVVMNNETRLYRGEAQSLFTKVPEALEHYKKYRNRLKIGFYSYAGFFLATLISVEGLDNEARERQGIGLIISFTTLINGVLFHSLSLSSLKKAIKTYNQYSLRY